MTCPTDSPDNPCPQCGFWRTARFSSGKFKKCPGCLVIERRARDRVNATKRRRRKGIAPAKGQPMTCERCKADTVRRVVRQRFCGPCTEIVKLENANRASLEKRIASGAVMVGATIACKHCNQPFQKPGSRACYCPDCRDLQRRGALPHLRAAGRKAWKTYAERHPDRVKTQQASSRERRKINPSFQINERMSAGVRQSLVHGKQGWRWEKLVGYNLADLMRHLERQFLPGMTWENRGEWHIDHVQPLASFRFESAADPEFRAAWCLSNLRPLWATENLSKNDRRTHLL